MPAALFFFVDQLLGANDVSKLWYPSSGCFCV